MTDDTVIAFRTHQGRDVADEDDAALDYETGGLEEDGARDMLGRLLVFVAVLFAALGAAMWPWVA